MLPIKRLTLTAALLCGLCVGWLGVGSVVDRRALAQQQLTLSPPPVITLTYGATINTDANLGNVFQVTITNGSAMTLANPTGGFPGQVITYRLRNTSGGAAGALSFGAIFKTGGAFTQAATANSRCIIFEFDGTNWVEVVRGAADVAN